MGIRLILTLCLLLGFCGLAHAQKKDPDPQKKEPDALERVMTELQAGRTEKALEALDEVIKQNPKNADAYLLRGSLRMQVDPVKALSDFDKLIELKPDSGPAYNQRAFLRLMNNDIAGALKDLDAAVAHKFNDESVYYLRGQLRWQTGDLNGALSDLNEAIKLNPGNARAYLSRGQLLLALNDFDRALADLNYLISWYEKDPSARPAPKPPDRNTANSQSPPAAASGNDSQPFGVQLAQQTSNEAPGAKEMAPAIADAYVNRGSILTDRGNHDAAFSDFDKAIRINPTNFWAFYYRAIEYEHKRDLPAALADTIKAAELEPKSGNFLVEQGVILLIMGKDKEAQAIFDRLLESDRALWQKRIDERTAALRKLIPIK